MLEFPLYILKYCKLIENFEVSCKGLSPNLAVSLVLFKAVYVSLHGSFYNFAAFWSQLPAAMVEEIT